ncbi:MAG: mechanosensitive ion channel [Muribaculaceae bacterium]|nr:mechanosensitive ion channel [Muribaculaceae bacterium]MDE5713617.1 mechanosensitive ion channel [Muribaculaceae bacterium]
MIQTEDLPVVPLPDKVDSGKSAFETLKGLGFDDAISSIANGMVQFAFKLFIAILVFYVGKFIIKKIYGLVYSIMVNRKVDASLTTFVLSLVKIVLFFILIVTVVGIIGIETSSFLALFASAGVAIGMALSGTLQNFAGGVLILLLKPYKVGDYIETQGFTGTVKEIQIFHTIINTADNKAIIIPNGGLSTGSINNYSLEQYRRVDWKIGLSYGNDYSEARKTILSMLNSDPRVVKQYIEDDMKIRREHELEEAVKDREASSGTDPVKKEGWWKRFRSRRKSHQLAIQEKLREQISLNEGLPVKKDCTPFVGLDELADSSINIVVRAWTHSSNYWGLFYEMNERFYKELPEHGFSFPFPQMDVHIADLPDPIKLTSTGN